MVVLDFIHEAPSFPICSDCAEDRPLVELPVVGLHWLLAISAENLETCDDREFRRAGQNRRLPPTFDCRMTTPIIVNDNDLG